MISFVCPNPIWEKRFLQNSTKIKKLFWIMISLELQKRNNGETQTLKWNSNYKKTLKDSRVVSPRCHKNLDRFVRRKVLYLKGVCYSETKRSIPQANYWTIHAKIPQCIKSTTTTVDSGVTLNVSCSGTGRFTLRIPQTDQPRYLYSGVSVCLSVLSSPYNWPC